MGQHFFWLCFFGAIVFLGWRLFHHPQEPSLYFSHLKSFPLARKSWKAKLALLPKRLQLISGAFFLLAFLDPHFLIEKTSEELTLPPVEGVAIYLVLDQSGSMQQKVGTITKLQVLKNVTKEFVKNRTDDLIGLVAFARTAKVLSPLTLDHQAIIDRLSNLNVIRDQTQDGTAIGYAIFKTVNLIAATEHYARDPSGKGKPAYEVKSAAIVLITDGLQDPNSLDKGNRLRTLDLEAAAEYAKDHGVRLYLINVEPKISMESFTPHRKLMRRITELTGGRFFLAGTPDRLVRVYAEINQMEKSVLPDAHQALLKLPKDKQPYRYRRISLYPTLIALGMFCFLAALILNTTTLKRVP